MRSLAIHSCILGAGLSFGMFCGSVWHGTPDWRALFAFGLCAIVAWAWLFHPPGARHE